MWQRTVQLLEMIRFSHTVFALPFALLASVIAWRLPGPDGRPVDFTWFSLLGILLCMVFARSAAMAFNRVVDRSLDAGNPRTADRHLPGGQVRVSTAVVFTGTMSVGFVASTLLFLPNRLPLILALPVLAFLLGYSYVKRWSAAAHFWLGAALMLAPICTWIAVRGQAVLADPPDAWPALLLGLAVFFWVAGFDIIYACQDVAFDQRAGLHSVPVSLGVRGALRCAALCHLGMLVLLCLLPLSSLWGGPALPLGWIYWLTLAAVAGLLIYEHSVVQHDDLTRVNVAFFQLNAVISIGLFVMVTIDMIV